MLWGSDFPHVVTRWPHSLAVLDSQMEGVAAEERHRMVAANAVEFFRL